MAGRTIAIGDVHGDLEGLERLLSRLPVLLPEDTLLFVGDYVDRGPHPADVVRRVRALPSETAARVVFLRGNHEDAWLKACREGAPEFVLPRGNGLSVKAEGGPVRIQSLKIFPLDSAWPAENAVDRLDLTERLDPARRAKPCSWDRPHRADRHAGWPLSRDVRRTAARCC